MRSFKQRLLPSAAAVIPLVFVFVPCASAITIPLSGFVLANSNADGFVVTSPDNLSLTLTGGNDGSGLFGQTDFAIPSPGNFTVTFQFNYSTYDYPQYDSAGYRVGSTLFQLADADGASGSISFAVTAGQTFGWWVQTFDNLGEPGVLNISALSYAGTLTGATPEPGSLLLCLAGAAAAGLWRMKK